MAIKKVNILKQIYKNFTKIEEKFTSYQNKKRKIVTQLKKKDKVYLLMKNQKLRKKSKKLNHVKVKIFFIKAKKETISYNVA